MTHERHHLFSLHDLLIIAALAALGGVSGSAISMIRAAAHAVIALPFGMQFLAGIHVLWFVLAVGLVRKPGAATITGLLAGTVELLTGNPHGLLVLMYGGLGGVGVDLVWLLLGGRHHPIVYMLAGGVGASANVLILKLVASLPTENTVVYSGLILLTGVAFLSGVVLAGLLGWWLMRALRLAGALGALNAASHHQSPQRHARIIALSAFALLLVTAIYWGTERSDASAATGVQAPRAASDGSTHPL